MISSTSLSRLRAPAAKCITTAASAPATADSPISANAWPNPASTEAPAPAAPARSGPTTAKAMENNSTLTASSKATTPNR